MTEPRRFHLQRTVDVTGASGTGRVADGVQWPDGTVSIRWRGDRPSIVFWGNIENAEHVHGHGGASRIVWDDPAPDDASVLRDTNTSRPISPAVDGSQVTRMVRIAVTGPTAGDADSWAQAVGDLVVGYYGEEMRLAVTIDGRPIDAKGEQR